MKVSNYRVFKPHTKIVKASEYIFDYMIPVSCIFVQVYRKYHIFAYILFARKKLNCKIIFIFFIALTNTKIRENITILKSIFIKNYKRNTV